MALYVKDPDSRLDYKVDWTSWLELAETISSSTWIVPTGLTKVDESTATKTATVWLTGGTAGQTYQVTNRITTNQNRTDDRTLEIVVRDR